MVGHDATRLRTDARRAESGGAEDAAGAGNHQTMIGVTGSASVATLLSVLAPLVAVPLTIITFYLRSLREHQVTWHAEAVRRIESLESARTALLRTLTEFERDFTTKEEWLRECMLARKGIEQLTESVVRIETKLQGFRPASTVRVVPGDDVEAAGGGGDRVTAGVETGAQGQS